MDKSSLNKFALIILTLSAWLGVLLNLYLILTQTSSAYSTDMLVANFFSYFTIQSNIIVALVATGWLYNKSFFGRYQKLFVLGGLINITITFVVVALVLSKLQSLDGLALVADNFVHIYTPILYVGYWLLFVQKTKIAFKYMLLWLAYPIGYLIYTLIRGSMVNWYPYPFVNGQVLSVPELARNIVLLTLAFFIVCSIFVFIGNMLASKNK